MERSERLRRLQGIFIEAQARSRAERGAYLDEACAGDSPLREEVDSLLRHDRGTAALLALAGIEQEMADHLAVAAESLREQDHPRQIGPFRIIRFLGDHASGTRFEAHQQNPRRSVELALFNASDAEVEARMLECELQLLGRLQHPGIAAIIETGRFGDRQHYMATELIRGVPLHEYCCSTWPMTGHGPTIEPRLRLFLRACRAISHAHTRGVVHHRLKPSNLLVVPDAIGTDEPTSSEHVHVKVLGFGPVSCADPSATEATVRSGENAAHGALVYVSPEQLCGNSDEIGPRSDIYALGVILHELLTGAPPYDVNGMTAGDARRAICEGSPAKPRTHLRIMRRDLESIILTAMAKHPGHRYPAVAALAADIQRYLAERPVAAHSSSPIYHLQRFLARRKLAFSRLSSCGSR